MPDEVLETDEHPPPAPLAPPQPLGGRCVRDGNRLEPGQCPHPNAKHCTVQPGSFTLVTEVWAMPILNTRNTVATSWTKILKMTMLQASLLLPFMGFASKFASLTSWQQLQFVFKFFRMFSIFTFNISYGQPWPILIPEKNLHPFPGSGGRCSRGRRWGCSTAQAATPWGERNLPICMIVFVVDHLVEKLAEPACSFGGLVVQLSTGVAFIQNILKPRTNVMIVGVKVSMSLTVKWFSPILKSKWQNAL